MAALAKLARSLGKLPGLGRRSAERMSMTLALDETGLVPELQGALRELAERVRPCSRCGGVTSAEQDPCRLCTDPGREGGLLCVVEDAMDIQTIERSGGYHGRYHALGGRLSPMKGQGPDDLRIRRLLERLEKEPFDEVVLALDTDTESDATASYLQDRLATRDLKVSRLAFGLPAGSGIAYADAVTLDRAFRGRQVMQ